MKEIFNIIYDKETELFFKRIGLLEQILQNQIKCISCQETITLSNFRGAFKKDNNLFFICKKDECFSFDTTQKMEEGVNG